MRVDRVDDFRNFVAVAKFCLEHVRWLEGLGREWAESVEDIQVIVLLEEIEGEAGG